MRLGFCFLGTGREGAMDTEEVYFSISERIYGVLHWFKEALLPLAEARFKEDQAVKEGQSVRVALGYLHEPPPDAPGVFADMFIPAFRSTVTPRLPAGLLESDLLPKGHKEQLVPLGPAICFRFSVLDDEIYVKASCAEFLPERAKKAFWELLQKVKARYPETKSSLQAYETERKERMREDQRRNFSNVGSATGASASAAIEGGPVKGADTARVPTVSSSAGSAVAPEREQHGPDTELDPVRREAIIALLIAQAKPRDKRGRLDAMTYNGYTYSATLRLMKQVKPEIREELRREAQGRMRKK